MDIDRSCGRQSNLSAGTRESTRRVAGASCSSSCSSSLTVAMRFPSMSDRWVFTAKARRAQRASSSSRHVHNDPDPFSVSAALRFYPFAFAPGCCSGTAPPGSAGKRIHQPALIPDLIDEMQFPLSPAANPRFPLYHPRLDMMHLLIRAERHPLEVLPRLRACDIAVEHQ